MKDLINVIKVGGYMVGMGLLSLGSILALSYCYCKYKSNREIVPEGERNQLLIYWPLIIMNAIAAFVVEVLRSDENNPYEELGYWVCIALLVVTFLVTFIQCRWKALWMGPVRWILGLMIGIAGYGAIIIAGVLLLYWIWSIHARIEVKPTDVPGVWVDANGNHYWKNDDGSFSRID